MILPLPWRRRKPALGACSRCRQEIQEGTFCECAAYERLYGPESRATGCVEIYRPVPKGQGLRGR